ncbi:hypothetical protein OHC33_003075 [Knufia fluminis]|uniref:Uncharacterized protein n=1 Tax=Knufia fluminis TaxID=191047 RepID=A0AAN8EP60_9EURO|nr:hypothetical protein OHC33_003075 [Knufia fluminis]
MGFGKVLLPLIHPTRAYKEAKQIKPSTYTETKEKKSSQIKTKLANKFQKERNAKFSTTDGEAAHEQSSTPSVQNHAISSQVFTDPYIIDHPNLPELPATPATPKLSPIILALEQDVEEILSLYSDRSIDVNPNLHASKQEDAAAQALSTGANKREVNDIFFRSSSADIIATPALRPSWNQQFEDVLSFSEQTTPSTPRTEISGTENWYINNAPSLPSPAQTYTQQQVHAILLRTKKELEGARTEASRLEGDLLRATTECSEAVREAEGAKSTVTTLREKVQKLRRQAEFDRIVLGDCLSGEPLQRLRNEVASLKRQHESDANRLKDGLYGQELRDVRDKIAEFAKTYSALQEENEKLSKELEQLKGSPEGSSDDESDSSSEDSSESSGSGESQSNPGVARLVEEANNARQRAHELQTERDSLRIQLSEAQKKLDAPNTYLSWEIDLKKREAQVAADKKHAEFLIEDHAPRYLSSNEALAAHQQMTIAPNVTKNQQQMIEHLQAELVSESTTSDALRKDIKDRDCTIKDQGREVANLRSRIAILAADYDEDDDNAVGMLKEDLIDTKLENEKHKLQIEKQREHYEQIIDTQAEKMRQLEADELTASVELQATKNKLEGCSDEAFLDWEERKKIDKLENIKKMYMGKVDELQAEMVSLRLNETCSELELDRLSSRVRGENNKYIRALVCKNALEARFADKIKASGRKVYVDFSTYEQSSSQGEIEMLKDVDYELYQPNVDVEKPEPVEYPTIETNWERQREEQERRAHKELLSTVNNAEAIAAHGHSVFGSPRKWEQLADETTEHPPLDPALFGPPLAAAPVIAQATNQQVPQADPAHPARNRKIAALPRRRAQ